MHKQIMITCLTVFALSLRLKSLWFFLSLRSLFGELSKGSLPASTFWHIEVTTGYRKKALKNNWSLIKLQVLLTSDSGMTPWTKEPAENDHNQPSCTSTRLRSILSWLIRLLSGSLNSSSTRWKCWTSLSLKFSFPIRFNRKVFMGHRNLNVNCDSGTFL